MSKSDSKGIGRQNLWSIRTLDRYGVKFFCLQNPKKSRAKGQKAASWHRSAKPRMLALRWHQVRPGRGIGGSKVFDFDPLDRDANTLAHPQNESFRPKTAENTARFHTAAQRGIMGRK